MRHDWQPLRVAPGASVRETMAVIDRARLGIALVVDDGDRLLGTVTDGDVRRAILRGVGLDAPASEVMATRFTALGDHATDQDALETMQAHQVRQVPALDREGRVRGIFALPDLLAGEARPNWVVVMAGGQGQRLRPLTNDLPKPMLPVGEQPLLEITVRRLVAHGLRELFLSVHYLGDRIEEHFGDGSAFGCHIRYLREPRPLGTGGALGLLPERPRHPLLVINGDLITDLNFSAMLAAHARHGGAATMCVREYTHEVPYGVVRVHDDRVAGLEEKPVRRDLINAGIYVLDPRLLALVPNGEPYPLTRLMEDAMAGGETVVPFVVHERWLDIGRPGDYEQVRKGVDKR
jgi:dTDP-glucose pyrophosphorylase